MGRILGESRNAVVNLLRHLINIIILVFRLRNTIKNTSILLLILIRKKYAIRARGGSKTIILVGRKIGVGVGVGIGIGTRRLRVKNWRVVQIMIAGLL